ncbi:MAG: protease modulator HflK, partial [Sphingopyxis sp.]
MNDHSQTPQSANMSEPGNGPWSGGKDEGGATGGTNRPETPASPWLPSGDGADTAKRGPRKRRAGPMDDWLSRTPFGPDGPNFAGGQAIWPAVAGGLVALWLLFTSIHLLDPQESGVVTRLGSYSRTVGSGITLTLPAPLERLQRLPGPLKETTFDIPGGSPQNLVLTSDANIINLTYAVRWTIKRPDLYLFQLADQDDTIRAAAESAMRATVANFTLAQAIGPGKTDIQFAVRRQLQSILDGYRMGVQVTGVAIRESKPPSEVADAFNEVNIARQRSDTLINEAQAYAVNVRQTAEG